MGVVVQIGEAPEGTYVSSVDFSNDGAFVGIGIGTGEVELWDVESGQKLRSMGGTRRRSLLSAGTGIFCARCAAMGVRHTLRRS